MSDDYGYVCRRSIKPGGYDCTRDEPTAANPSDSLRARLTAFARDCTTHGDMTLAAERMLRRILEETK